MRIRWTGPSVDDLEGIQEYLEIHYAQFAETTVRTIYKRILALKTLPYSGRPGHYPGTRELVLAPLPYVVVYRLKLDAIEILHIHHGAQDWRSISLPSTF